MATTNANAGLLIVLVGPSGVGKSTISRSLAERMHLKYIASATTRKETPKDKEGKKYEFVDQNTFFKKLENGESLIKTIRGVGYQFCRTPEDAPGQ